MVYYSLLWQTAQEGFRTGFLKYNTHYKGPVPTRLRSNDKRHGCSAKESIHVFYFSSSVFKIISDMQDVISLNFIADEKSNQYPILSINDNIYPITNRIELNK